jgi:site-specific DNA-cytosine methylase
MTPEVMIMTITYKENINGLALCAGVGGLELGLQIALGEKYRTVCFVEGEAYPAAGLVQRMEEGLMDKAPIWNNVRTFDGKPWRGKVHLLAGGYPCQPFSIAGKKQREEDPRHLWPDFLRIIREVEPQVVFVENVVHHLRLGFREVRRSLQALGYRVEAGIFSASEIGGTHSRERLFGLAVLGNTYCPRLEGRRDNLKKCTDKWNFGPPSPSQRVEWSRIVREKPFLAPSVERGFCRMVDGLPHALDFDENRQHRLRAIGNAVVPLAAANAFDILYSKIEKRQL